MQRQRLSDTVGSAKRFLEGASLTIFAIIWSFFWRTESKQEIFFSKKFYITKRSQIIRCQQTTGCVFEYAAW